MIKKTPGKQEWGVYSESGDKNLGKYPTKEEAEERLRQVEYFKHKTNSMGVHVINIANTKETEKRLPGAWAVPIFQGKALVMKRVDEMWDFPGGTIDKGESSLQAAVRELEEEAGIKTSMDSLQPVGVDIIDGRYLNLFFTIIDEEQVKQLTLKEDEHTEYAWISKTEDIPGKLNPPTEEFKKQGWLDNLDVALNRINKTKGESK